jgi:hypothetical protein
MARAAQGPLVAGLAGEVRKMADEEEGSTLNSPVMFFIGGMGHGG